MRKFLIGLALLAPSMACAQTATTVPSNAPTVGYPAPTSDGGRQLIRAVTITDVNGVPAVGGRESFQLIAANTPSAAATVFGGDYILSQACTTYGTLNFQVLGPDGATWQTVLSKTASDSAGGTGMSLGSYAQVRITVTGTTGCNAILARVPS